MKVLIVGGGGREHAIAWKVSQSPLLTELYCTPGNAGTAEFATNLDLSVANTGAIALWAVENEIDLTIVGPEAPLADGIVDLFHEHGLKIFGPSKSAAQLEASKSFAKEVMLKAGVPTAKAKVFKKFEPAKKYVKEQGVPIVIKADGLAAGKGVTVAMTMDDAIAALEECARVVIEDYVDGREASLIGIVDGTTVVPLVLSQDYKRLEDNDEGPNTGGMGAISPTSVLEDKRLESLVAEVFLPVLRELWGRGIKFVGFLYAGMIVDKKTGDLSVLEFNCRLGDPETQVLLMRMKSDLLEILDAACRGKLSSRDLKWSSDSACCIVASSSGYPGDVDDGKIVEGLFEPTEDLVVFHAGTELSEDKKVRTKGGRILSVAASAPDMNQALAKASEGIKRITFEGLHFRSDIGVTKP
ncbi:UNVERIFIED_CONTAM: hypothetical protein GTU68_039609 [Idotea baltica]|nr:hypothetical protein [Idotea baltica]